jgi:hypothetical protein
LSFQLRKTKNKPTDFFPEAFYIASKKTGTISSVKEKGAILKEI